MPKQPTPHISVVRKEGATLVIEFGRQTKLTITPHIVEHSQHSWHKLPPDKEISYVEEVSLIDAGKSITVVFDQADARGQITELNGLSQRSLTSHWSVAACHIRKSSTNLPADIKQIIAAGDHQLEDFVNQKLKAPATPHTGPFQRVARALSASRRIAH